MLSKIVEETLRDYPGRATIDAQTFKDELETARAHTLELIRRHLTEFGDKFPAETCVQGYYPLTDNIEWTTSFWTGQLWLAWEMSGEEPFRALAERHVRSFGVRIAGRHDTNTHDLGFFIHALLRGGLAVDRQPGRAGFCIAGGGSTVGTLPPKGADHPVCVGRSRGSGAGRSHDHRL